MESNKFDALARRAVGEDSSRRGVLRAGIGALAASAMAVVGLSAADDAAADKKKNGKNHQRDAATRRRHRTTVICYLGETLEVKKDKVNQKFPGHQPGACICQAPTPVSCGLGCCAADFPLCCPNPSFGSSPGQTAGSTCAPITSRCCPPNQGGGACDSPTPQCCPPTNQQPRGFCAPVDAVCCPSNLGGSFCPAPFTKCCPPLTAARGGFAPCCRQEQRCCNNPGATGPAAVTAGCLAGQACNFEGCCTADVNIVSGDDSGARRSPGAAKVGIAPV
jgi:hypothetical protein